MELENEGTPILICNMCQMTAKNYLKFVEKIKKSQEQFEKPKLAVTQSKRFYTPAILKGAKRKQTDQVIGMIGNSTVIRLVGSSSDASSSSSPYSYLQLEPERVGESSKAKKIKATEENLKIIICAKCETVFENQAELTRHFRFCLENELICPLCFMRFKENLYMVEHYFVKHLSKFDFFSSIASK